jgi:hypothetical protein
MLTQISRFAVMSFLLSLPQELIEMIIDFLFDDKQTLKACSLASRAFLAASRLHLFAHIHLEEDTDNHPRFAQFLSFVGSSSSIVTFVRSLRVELIGRSTHYDMRNLHTLPQLKSLSVKGSMFDSSLSLYPLLSPEPWCRQITNLSMENQGFSCFDEFAAFITLFTSLEQLTMNNMLWYHTAPARDLHRLPSTLRILELQSCGFFQLFNWLLFHDPMPSLHTIALTSQDSNEFIAKTNKLCSSLGPSLRNFELNYFLEDSFDHQSTLWYIFAIASRLNINNTATPAFIDLSQNTELRSISLSNFLIDDVGSASDIAWILSHVSSCHMEEVTLKCIPRSYYGGSNDCWPDISTALESPKYAHLKTVRVKIVGFQEELDWQSARDAIRQRLSSCDARGLLTFC